MWAVERSTVEQQKLVSFCAASGVKSIAQLSLVSATEEIQVVQQNGDGQPA